MQRRNVIHHAGSMLAGSALLATPFIGRPARAATTWTAFSAQPPGSASVRGLQRLAEQLTTATVGAFSLQVRPLGTLAVNGANLVHAVATGPADLAEDPFYSSPVPAGRPGRPPML